MSRPMRGVEGKQREEGEKYVHHSTGIDQLGMFHATGEKPGGALRRNSSSSASPVVSLSSLVIV